MTDTKDVDNTEVNRVKTSEHGIDELANTHINPDTSTSSTVSSTAGFTRTNSPPFMGTYARTAKRRVDSGSSEPLRIDDTDIQNQQHHYQNFRQIPDDTEEPPSPTSKTEISLESRESFSAKRDYFEQRFKTPPPTYDAPPIRKPSTQKIITTITTTTTAVPVNSNIQDRTSSSSNESPSVDRVLEQAVELQKMSNIKSSKHESLPPLVIERTEEYQVFLNSVNHEIRRTPSISRTTIIPASKIGHATDLDEAQAQIQVDQLADDHEAIQQLTRALQEHNVSTINEYKRLPSVTIPSTPSILPPAILTNRTNLSVISNEFSVIDALLNNPIGSVDDQYNSLLNVRYNDIMNNLHNPEYLNTIKQSTTKTSKNSKARKESKGSKESKPIKESKSLKESKPSKESKKKSKEKKSKKKSSSITETVEQASITPRLESSQLEQTQITEQTISPTTVSSEQAPLIDPKEKKKQDKENKKQTKIKSKQKSKNGDYEVLDAIIGSPISLRLPDSYLSKYNVSAPLSQSSLSPPISPSIPAVTTTTTISTKGKVDNSSIQDKNQTLSHLVKIVHELQLHNAAALVASLNSTPSKTNTTKETKQPIITDKRTIPVTHESVEQQPLLEQQKRPVIHHTQTEVRPQSEVIKPRIIYRYIDEHGRVLKISSTPPSQLREQPSQQQYTYRHVEPPYFHGRYIAIDDERRHPLPTHEQRAAWQGEPKLPTTVTREDFELRDKRVPHISEQSVPNSRTIPISVDADYSSKSYSSHHQHRTHHHHPNQQNVKLAWLPLSYQAEQAYAPNGTVGYDTDSTISERSATYRPYEYGPVDSHYYQSHRPLHNDYYYNRSSGPSYYPSPPPMPYGGRGISPEYGGVPRNYIEVFRGGDFRETKPSEIYSLPLNEHIRTSPITPSSNRHSRYDQYQSERYGSGVNRNNISEPTNYYTNTLPNPRYQTNIPPTTVHTSSYYSHRSPCQHRTVQSSPNPDYPNFVRQSKSFDYRPLRTKLQREYKITPNLLVDEWEFPHSNGPIKHSTTTTTTANTIRSRVSSPDDVFSTNPLNETSP